mmetsp:Transcript_34184/g.28867  ORF Transcript_34184/g.28867 Transcript_34184/m.28867 type:complete len:188 (+) Transcript_34184:42-605(+)
MMIREYLIFKFTNLCRQKSPGSLGNALQSTATHTHLQPLTNRTLSANKPSLSTQERNISRDASVWQCGAVCVAVCVAVCAVCVKAKECHISAKEPSLSAKEPYIFRQKNPISLGNTTLPLSNRALFLSVKESSLSTKEGHFSAKAYLSAIEALERVRLQCDATRVAVCVAATETLMKRQFDEVCGWV